MCAALARSAALRSLGLALVDLSDPQLAADATDTLRRAAADLIGAKVLLLGSESPTDDPAREIEILNQIVQDPTLDGLIMTTPQVGAYNDIVSAAESRGIPVATTNSYDGTLLNRNGISHTGQDASAAAIAGEALVDCLMERGVDSGSILLPSSTAMGNIEVNNRVTSAFNAIVLKLQEAGKLENFKVDAGPEAATTARPRTRVRTLTLVRSEPMRPFQTRSTRR